MTYTAEKIRAMMYEMIAMAIICMVATTCAMNDSIITCMLVNHGPSKQSSKEEYKPSK